uniref:Uncharacterized protein n=1 Tax=Lygus hesperus TaxID=30085 RepID=A0A0K8T845_LYGHE
MRDKVLEILFKYRATPLKNGKTPSELFLNRQLRIKLDALRPAIRQPIQTSPQLEQARQLKVGNRVMARYYGDNKQHWRPGVIVEKYGKLHYSVKLDNDYVLKRHIDQLRFVSDRPKKRVTFAQVEEKEQSSSTKHLPSSNIHHDLHEQVVLSHFQPAWPSLTQESTTTGSDASTAVPLRRSGRERQKPSHLKDFIVGNIISVGGI